jgi:hypothetical protein
VKVLAISCSLRAGSSAAAGTEHSLAQACHLGSHRNREVDRTWLSDWNARLFALWLRQNHVTEDAAAPQGTFT